jgi:hypothetical protein
LRIEANNSDRGIGVVRADSISQRQHNARGRVRAKYNPNLFCTGCSRQGHSYVECFSTNPGVGAPGSAAPPYSTNFRGDPKSKGNFRGRGRFNNRNNAYSGHPAPLCGVCGGSHSTQNCRSGTASNANLRSQSAQVRFDTSSASPQPPAAEYCPNLYGESDCTGPPPRRF